MGWRGWKTGPSTPTVKKFDKAADAAVTSGVQPIFNTDGKRVVMAPLHQRRIKAQMDR
jgi:hypothetical protein